MVVERGMNKRFFIFENFLTTPFLGKRIMYGPGSSKKNGVVGAKEEVSFLNVHTQLAKKGGGVVTHLYH